MAESIDLNLRSALSSVSESLNKASDALAKRISDVESALKGYHLGVTAWVEVSRNIGDAYERVHSVGYGKHEGNWGLLAATFIDEDPDATWQEYFLREAPRDLRLECVDKIPELLRKLVENAQKVAKQAAGKAETLGQIATILAQRAR